jgi:hypothetical protein
VCRCQHLVNAVFEDAIGQDMSLFLRSRECANANQAGVAVRIQPGSQPDLSATSPHSCNQRPGTNKNNHESIVNVERAA